MPYVRIVLTNIRATRRQEEQLCARSVEVLPGLIDEDCKGTMVSIEEATTSGDFLEGADSKAVDAHIYTSLPAIPAHQRTRLKRAVVDMIKGVLGDDADTRYRVHTRNLSTEGAGQRPEGNQESLHP